MGLLNLLKKKRPLAEKDFYTYNFFEHPKELKGALPEKEALLKLPTEERANMLAQKVKIHHLDPDGDSGWPFGGWGVLSIAPYLLRFPIDQMLELLKGLPEKDQKSLLNTYVERQSYSVVLLRFHRMEPKRTVYETCLSDRDKAKKMKIYASYLDPQVQNKINKKLRKDFTHPYTNGKERE